MASINQTRPHCVNKMRKAHSKPLATRHGRVTAWARHAMFELAFTVLHFASFRCFFTNHVALSPDYTSNWTFEEKHIK